MVSLYTWLSQSKLSKLLFPDYNRKEIDYLVKKDISIRELHNSTNLLIQHLYRISNQILGDNQEQALEVYDELKSHMEKLISHKQEILINHRLGPEQFSRFFSKIQPSVNSKKTLKQLHKDTSIRQALRTQSLDVQTLYERAAALFENEMNDSIEKNKQDLYQATMPHPHLQEVMKILNRFLAKETTRLGIPPRELEDAERRFLNTA